MADAHSDGPRIAIIKEDERWWVVCNSSKLIAFKEFRDAVILSNNLIKSLSSCHDEAGSENARQEYPPAPANRRSAP